MARPKFETVARVGQPSGIQSIVRRSLRAGEEKPFEVVLYKAHSLKPIRSRLSTRGVDTSRGYRYHPCTHITPDRETDQ